jgi:hypothetical protein
MDLTSDSTSKKRTREETKEEDANERFQKRVQKAKEERELKEAREKRLALQPTSWISPTDVYRRWDEYPDWYPRFYAYYLNDVQRLVKEIHRFTGIPFAVGHNTSELEQERFVDGVRQLASGILQVSGTFRTSPIDGQAGPFPSSDPSEIKDVYKKMSEFKTPVVMCDIQQSADVRREWNSNFPFRAQRLLPSTIWDLIRDGPFATPMEVRYVVGERTDESSKEIDKFTEKPPSPVYFIEEEGDGLKDTLHLRLLIQDLIVNTPRALSLAKMRNALGTFGQLPLDEWQKSYDERASQLYMRCVIQPSPNLKYSWLWDPYKEQKNAWPIRYSTFVNRGPLFAVNTPAITRAILKLIQLMWGKDAPKLYRPELNFVEHLLTKRESKRDIQDERTTDIEAGQNTADEFAQYMHFPSGSRQFHLLLEFGFINNTGSYYSAPYNSLNFENEAFMPDCFIPPTPHIALLKKLDAQGQLLRIRCFEVGYGFDGNEGLHYIELANGDYEIHSVGVMDTIKARIGRAQYENTRTEQLLEKLSISQPRLGIQAINPLIRSFLGGKYCHNPGCKKESTVNCGHCENANYCSSECAGKHWPSHQ